MSYTLDIVLLAYAFWKALADVGARFAGAAGDRFYRAPEVLLGLPYGQRPGPATHGHESRPEEPCVVRHADALSTTPVTSSTHCWGKLCALLSHL